MNDSVYHKPPFSTYLIRKKDANNKFLSELNIAKILLNAKINCTEFYRISKNKFKVKFMKISDANILKTYCSKNTDDFFMMIPKHKIVQRGVIRRIPEDIDSKELIKLINNENLATKAASAFRLQRKIKD